jgi:hypothetical protein
MAQLMDGETRLRAWIMGADEVAPPRAAVDQPAPADAADGGAAGQEAVGGTTAGGRAGPVLDADGLLRHGGRWVPIPDTQIPVADLLVRNVGTLVASSEIRDTYIAAGGSGSATSLRSLVHRLGRRVAAVGLRLHVVRGRGVILDGDPTSG